MSDPTPHAAEIPAASPTATAETGPDPAADPFPRRHEEPALQDAGLHAAPTAEAVPPAPPNRSGRGLMPAIYALGFIVIVVALVWLWQHPNRDSAAVPADTAVIGALGNQTQALAQQVQDLAGRVAALEQRPAAVAAPAPDLAPLEARIAALENARAAPAAPPQPDPATQSALTALTARLNQLARTQSGAQSGTTDLAAKLDALSRSQQSADADLTRRLDALAAQSAADQRASAEIAGLADRASRTARLQAASAALAAGQPLGTIPEAPPALARFAAAPPPTEAALRLAFPASARAAERASRPDLGGKPFLTRVWLRVQEAVTVRQDDRVIVGDPAAGIIAGARRALDAGDLAGAVDALGGLQPPAAQAMAGWIDQARALLAARAALAGMARSG